MSHPSDALLTPWGQGATQHFFSLTPEHVLNAVESQGWQCTGRAMALGSMENRVYEVEIELPPDEPLRSPSDRFIIVKFYRPGRWSKEAIQDEHDFMIDLFEHDIPVIVPFSDDQGQSVFFDDALKLYFAVFPKIGGRSPTELQDDQCERIGRLLARLHAVGSTKKAPSRIVLNAETYGRGNLSWLRSSGVLPPHFEREFSSVCDEIFAFADPLFEKIPAQRIHGDAHLGNLLWNDQGPFWVDFDDMVTGPVVQDLWLILPGRDEEAQAKLRLMLRGYRLLNDFSNEWLQLIEPLRALRLIHFAAWIGKRWDDPSFKRGFPDYGTDKYWHELIRDLREQLLLTKSQPWRI